MNRVLTALGTALDILEAAGVEYAISGSLAAAHHGYPRATEDVDIQVAIDSASELETLAQDLPPEARRIDVATWRFPGDIDVELYRTTDPLDERAMAGRVDGPLPSGGEDDREEDRSGTRTAWFVDLEPLLVLKIREHVRHGHGHKHIADIEQLIARNHDRLDVDRLDELLALDPAWEDAWDELVESA